jgi:tripartite-type tricarboxylate transporter receptor subunit TctC
VVAGPPPVVGRWRSLRPPPAVVKALRDAVRQAVQDPEFKSAMEKAQTPIAYQDADEFKAWWDKDAHTLAEVVKRIGKVEEK